MTHGAPPPSGHPAELLPAYLNGTLDRAAQERVRRHLDGCAACRAELAEWRTIGAAARTATAPLGVPGLTLLERVWATIDAPPAVPAALAVATGPGVRFLLVLLLAQVPLVRRQLWVTSTLVLGVGCAVTLLSGRGAVALLTLLAPVIAAAGVAGIYGPDHDPSLELALATPTSPRLILLARLTLVCGHDLLLALLASATLVGLGRAPDGLARLILQWLGPMLLLSAISLGLSLWCGAALGVGVALTLWAVKVALTFPIPPAPTGGRWPTGARSTSWARRTWSRSGWRR